MKYKIYKTKDIDGVVFRTPDVQSELNIKELTLSSQATLKLFNLIPQEDFENIIVSFGTNNISFKVLSKAYDILANQSDDLFDFIRFVMIENGYEYPVECFKVADAKDNINALVLMFRLYYEELIKNIDVKFTNGTEKPATANQKQ